MTGGVAFSDSQVSTAFGASPSGVFPASAFTSRQVLVGGTIGGGFEYGITRNLSLGIEGGLHRLWQQDGRPRHIGNVQ